MTKAIVLRQHGDADELRLEEVPLGTPGLGELRVRHDAIGVNFHDTYVRSGLYRTLPLPGIPGLEAAGTVIAIGQGIEDFAPGDRIAYLDTGYGAYAEERLLNAKLAVPLPEHISCELAASVLLKGLTAGILATRVHLAKADEVALVHAAAGGVGRLLVQWLTQLGVRVIGTVGSQDKAEVARSSGCAEIICYREEDFVGRVFEITDGSGADVVYDSIGRDTFDDSLAALAVRGHLVNFGQSSGTIPPIDIRRLAPKSATISRPGYSHYIRDRADLLSLSHDLWQRFGDGSLRAEPGTSLNLANAAEAHRLLESRAVGPFILVP